MKIKWPNILKTSIWAYTLWIVLLCSRTRIKRNIMRLSMEACPLSGFYLIDADFFTEIHLKKLSNLPSFRAIWALIASQLTYEKQHFIFLLSYCYLHFLLRKFCSVLTCDILGIGLFKCEDEKIKLNSFKCMVKDGCMGISFTLSYLIQSSLTNRVIFNTESLPLLL